MYVRLVREAGRLIASGRSADVFEAGDGEVLIRYREPRDVRRQAELIVRLVASGFPAPRVLEVGDCELVVERVEGPTMFAELMQHPQRVESDAALLASLHERLHAVGVCHHDLHPLNVILAPSGPVVIDWEAANEDSGAVDLAETWLLLATAEIPDEIRPLADQFLEAFLRHVDRESARQALPQVVQRRLLDSHMTDGELGRIRNLLTEVGHVALGPAGGDGP